MLAVISPSKTQDFSHTNLDTYSQTRQGDESMELILELKSKTWKDLAKLMSISEKLAKLNFERFQQFSSKFSLKNAKQAILAFKGDVYNGIDATSLSKEGLLFAQDKVRMLSGLYGVIRPLDLIQPYRLEMGTKLQNAKGKNLYDFWGDKISKILNQDESEVIINLASNEYFKGIDKKSIQAKIVNVVFKENKNGVYKVIGIYAKRARGLMIRYIVDHQINNPESLKDFNVEGYAYSSELSDDKNFVFTRG